MNEDQDILDMTKEISDIIEKFNSKIDLANLVGILIGIVHLIGEDSGYKRKDWNHILWELIKKNYRVMK